MFEAIWRDVGFFDVVHCHDYRTLQTLIASQSAHQSNVPLILQPHGALPYGNRLTSLKRFFDQICKEFIFSRVSRFIALNDSEAKTLINFGIDPDKIVVFPNGINLDDYKKLPPSGWFRHKVGLPRDRKIVLYLGRIHPNKNLELLIRAFALLRDHDANLVLVGPDDGHFETIQNLVRRLSLENRFIYTGYISFREKLGALVDADVTAIPVFYGFPLTILESLACGTPVITTSAGDVLQEIDGRAGLVVDPEPEALASGLRKLLDQGKQSYSSAAKTIVEKYSWRSLVNELEKIYYQLI